MNASTSAILLEVLKTGGIILGFIAAAGLLFLFYRFQRTGANGLGEKVAKVAEQLQGLQGLPLAINTLNGTLATLAASLPTKQELTAGFQENRHDARNAIHAVGLAVEARVMDEAGKTAREVRALEETVDRRLTTDRRAKPRHRKKDRRRP